MIQFYLLSVVFNTLAGLLLIFTKPMAEDSQEATIAGISFLETKKTRLILGIATAFVGLMKILSVINNDVPVIGDLLPAAMGIIAGLTLLYEYYISTSSVKVELNHVVETLIVGGRRYVGFACLIVALLHFLLPRALFL